MNFGEWVKQISREMGVYADKKLIEDILLTAFRVVLEEFGTNPAEADLDLNGIGRFYFNHRVCHNNFPIIEEREYITRWTIQFRPYRKIKFIVNGRIPLTDATVGGRYLYPEYHTDEEGYILTKKGNRTSRKIKEKEIRHRNDFWLKKIEEIQNNKIKLTEEKTFEPVDEGEQPSVKEQKKTTKKRGRPRKNKHSPRKKKKTKDKLDLSKHNTNEELNSEKNKNCFGDNLKKIRKKRKISQGELGEKLSVSKSIISRWENNKLYPQVITLLKIADILNVEPSELLE